MAYLKKRGKYYYAKWHTTFNGKRKSVRKALGTRHKDVVQKMLRELEKLESLGTIDPFRSGFDPPQVIKINNQNEDQIQCPTVKEVRKHEAAYSPEISYSGLKGKNLVYEDGSVVISLL